MGWPTPQYSASATGRFMMYQGNIPVIVDAGTALDAAGATAIGKALLTAADESAAFAALPSVYHKANILGAVSQSGGVPTGAIIERGSTSNGNYIRYADGTQICTANSTVFAATGGAIGWTFPAAFSANPYVDLKMQIGSGADASQYNAEMTYQGLSGSGATLTYTTASTVTGHYIAIGRWF